MFLLIVLFGLAALGLALALYLQADIPQKPPAAVPSVITPARPAAPSPEAAPAETGASGDGSASTAPAVSGGSQP